MPPLETGLSTTVRPFSLFSIDNNTQLGTNDGAELKYPDYFYLISYEIIIPVLTYITFWYSVNLVVTAHCWTTWQEGIRRKRLINLTTSLIHSSISSIFLLVFFCRHTRLMFDSPLHYYDYISSQVILFSVGYFIYDGFDMVINDKISIVTGVLLVHHTASIFLFSTAIASRKFLLYAFWALLMEVNSIFLHARSILHQSKLSTTSMIAVTKIVCYFNLGTFLIFRFGVQVFLTGWAWVNRNNMHPFYMYLSLGGSFLFLVINVGIFLRILHSDGLMLSSVVQREKLDSLLEDNDFDVKSTERKELLM